MRSAERLAGSTRDILAAVKGVSMVAARPATTWSKQDLALQTRVEVNPEVAGTASTLQSTAQVNDTINPNSYWPPSAWVGQSTAVAGISGSYTGLDDDIFTFTAGAGTRTTLSSTEAINGGTRSAFLDTTSPAWSGTSSAAVGFSGLYTGTTNRTFRLTAGAQTTASLRSSAQINDTMNPAYSTTGAWAGASTASRSISGTYTGADNDTFRFTVGSQLTAGLRSSAQINDTMNPAYSTTGAWAGASTASRSISGTYTGADDDTFRFTVGSQTTASVRSSAQVNGTMNPAYTTTGAWAGASTASRSISGTYTGADDDTFRFTVGSQVSASLRSSAQINNTMNPAYHTTSGWSGTGTAAPSVTGTYTGVDNDTWTYTVTGQTNANIASTAAIHTTDTASSYTTGAWSGSSKATRTVSGTYTGTTNEVYTFTVNKQKIDVTNSAGQRVTSLNTNSTSAQTVENGLSVTLGNGTKNDGETFTVTARAAVTGVNAANAFNGVGSAAAGFDPGQTVTNGSFKVNGVTISVATTDSINSVISRINASAAGVTASYSAATERVTIASNTAGSGGTNPTLSNDTSGLLAALKLSTATATAGTDTISVQDASGATLKTFTYNKGQTNTVADGLSVSFGNGLLKLNETFTTNVFITAPASVNVNTAFNASPGFEAGRSVTAGSFKVNGVSISVLANDTITSVMSKITSSAAGVTATFDSANEAVVLTSNTAGSGGSVTVSNDTSGFLNAVKLDTGAATTGSDSIQVRDSSNALVKAFTYTAGQTVSVADGLSVSFGSGSLVSGDTFDVGVFITAPASVNVDTAFNASPGFEAGRSVSAGSFSINGVSISVLANDTITSVMSKITNSAAGVTATFDAANEAVVLTAKTAGSGGAVSLGADTSGFLNAVKLDNGTTTTGSDDITVRDSSNALLKAFTYTAGQTVSVADGLSVSFGSGALVSGDTFDVGVFISAPASVNPDTAFNASPGFEAGRSVSAGSFSINGVSISVAADDTVNSVLAKINNSAAGVTATFDQTNEQVVLAATTSGSGGAVTLGADTSGFLHAVKLDDGVSTTGSADITVTDSSGSTIASFTYTGGQTVAVADGLSVNFGSGALESGDTFDVGVFIPAPASVDVDAAFDASPGFEAGRSVSAGSFSINGVSISVAADDTVNSVLAKINNSGAGVTATFDQADEQVVLTSTTAGSGGAVTLGADTSGFLNAVKLDDGTAVTGSDSITVTDGTGATVTTFTHEAGQTHAVADGLSVGFGAGAITAGDYAEVTAYAETDAVFDADAAFDETNPLAAAGFQAGHSVGAGSFTVNGVAISVAADDTLNSVLARINAAGAGATAAYDAATETVMFTATSEGSAGQIVLAGDTSGLIGAIKLSGATATAGTDLIVVTDSSGQTVDAFSHSAGETHAFADGLSVSFGAGEIRQGDSFTLEVNVSAPATIDTTKAFNGTGRDAPGFEDGFTITDGSFEVNGVSIAVSVTDSLDDVLARITASEAGVDATFDSATERVVLTNRATGSEDIQLRSDTSGLLAALKLDGASATLGIEHVAGTTETIIEAEQAMAEVEQFTQVTAGTIVVNGVEVAFDPFSDSVADVLRRISDATTVSAVLSNDHKTATLIGRKRGEAMSLDDGGTGLLTALAIDPGTITPRDRGTSMSAAKRSALAREIVSVRSELSELWNLGNDKDLRDLRTTMVDTFRSMSEADRKIMKDLVGVSVTGGQLTFDNRTVAAVAAELAKMNDAAIRRLYHGGTTLDGSTTRTTGRNREPGVVGALLGLSNELGRRSRGR